ncbi:MAG: YggS family pyridoxal phosphate-dependent enzyme [Myxococcota bacterium]|jgi:hypothetical protein|nr:YggS family pyridoxal phosphate-dependent enzyme [Myxococcota bacterium]
MKGMEPDIAANLQRVRERISRACEQAGRDPAGVRLLAASKGVDPDRVRLALGAGQALFGETRAQELRDKSALLGAGPEWHFIGRLQRNKVRNVVGCATVVHTVDRFSLAEALASRAVRYGRVMGVLVQVNVGSEPQKSGVSSTEALELCERIHGLDGVEVRGLMCLPPWSDEPDGARPWFRGLAELAVQGRDRGLPLTELSMGMSRDLECAVAEGSTCVRVGTAIFGQRPT